MRHAALAALGIPKHRPRRGHSFRSMMGGDHMAEIMGCIDFLKESGNFLTAPGPLRTARSAMRGRGAPPRLNRFWPVRPTERPQCDDVDLTVSAATAPRPADPMTLQCRRYRQARGQARVAWAH
jgi:hypothetical protein